jgi:hypothetical protein
MTPTERRATLDALGWSVRRFADAIRYDEKMCRMWLAGTDEAPEEIDAWLGRRLAAISKAVAATPPPARSPLKPRRSRGRPRKAPAAPEVQP